MMTMSSPTGCSQFARLTNCLFGDKGCPDANVSSCLLALFTLPVLSVGLANTFPPTVFLNTKESLFPRSKDGPDESSGLPPWWTPHLTFKHEFLSHYFNLLLNFPRVISMDGPLISPGLVASADFAPARDIGLDIHGKIYHIVIWFVLSASSF